MIDYDNDYEIVSSCCGADVHHDLDICLECREWCDTEKHYICHKYK
jgi:hypothetical protein